MAPTPELTALLRKYRRLAELRRARQEHGAIAAAAELRQLAREFPGALRELDVLPAGLIETRIAELERALAGEAARPWMGWMLDYHGAMRLFLDIKRRLSLRRDVDEGQASAVASAVRDASGRDCSAELVLAVARPPGGRLNRLAFERLAAKFQVEGDVIAATLFPALPK